MAQIFIVNMALSVRLLTTLIMLIVNITRVVSAKIKKKSKPSPGLHGPAVEGATKVNTPNKK